MMRAIYEVGGKGHSCGIYSFDQDHIHRLALAAPVSRIMVRQPQSKANAGAFNNGMPMTSSLGCGTWGGNIVSENVHLKHYMNTTWVSVPIKEDKPSDEELFGDVLRRRAGSGSRGDHRLKTRGATPRRDSMTKKTPEETACRRVAWWDTSHHRHPPGQDRDSRLSDRGADRPRALSGHDLADAARRTADARPVGSPGGGAGAGRRSRPARAVHRDLAHGGDLRACRSTARWPRRSTCSTTSTAAPASNAWSSIARSTRRPARTAIWSQAATAIIERHRSAGEKIVPGFGHRFHPVDPRTAPLFALVAKAEAAGVVVGALRRDRPRGRERASRRSRAATSR